eukprot:6491019-Amphidinium_carterae.1
MYVDVERVVGVPESHVRVDLGGDALVVAVDSLVLASEGVEELVDVVVDLLQCGGDLIVIWQGGLDCAIKLSLLCRWLSHLCCVARRGEWCCGSGVDVCRVARVVSVMCAVVACFVWRMRALCAVHVIVTRGGQAKGARECGGGQWRQG